MAASMAGRAAKAVAVTLAGGAATVNAVAASMGRPPPGGSVSAACTAAEGIPVGTPSPSGSATALSQKEAVEGSEMNPLDALKAEPSVQVTVTVQGVDASDMSKSFVGKLPVADGRWQDEAEVMPCSDADTLDETAGDDDYKVVGTNNGHSNCLNIMTHGALGGFKAKLKEPHPKLILAAPGTAIPLGLSGPVPEFQCMNCRKYLPAAELNTCCTYHPRPFGELKSASNIRTYHRWQCCGYTDKADPGCLQRPYHRECTSYTETLVQVGCTSLGAAAPAVAMVEAEPAAEPVAESSDEVQLKNGWRKYEIQDGDSLMGLSLRFGLKTSTLSRYNGIIDGRLTHLLHLWVPKNDTPNTEPPVDKASTADDFIAALQLSKGDEVPDKKEAEAYLAMNQGDLAAAVKEYQEDMGWEAQERVDFSPDGGAGGEELPGAAAVQP